MDIYSNQMSGNHKPPKGISMRKLSVFFGACSVFAFAAPAFAADAPSDSQAFGLGEIVVTAPKVQGVAVDATTLSSTAIEAFAVPRLDEAVNLIPGVNASNTGGSRNERLILVRGFNRFQVPLLIAGR